MTDKNGTSHPESEPSTPARTWPSLATSIKLFVEVLALPTAYFLFTGIIYAYYYYQHFGIALQDVDLPLHFYLIYAFSVLYENVMQVAILGIVLIAGTWFASRRSSQTLRNLLLLVLLLVIFPVLWVLAREFGQERAQELRNGYGGRQIAVIINPIDVGGDALETLTPGENENGGKADEDVDAGGDVTSTDDHSDPCPKATVYSCYWLAQTDDHFVVLSQAFIPGPELPMAEVLWLAKDSVSSVSVRIQNIPRIEKER